MDNPEKPATLGIQNTGRKIQSKSTRIYFHICKSYRLCRTFFIATLVSLLYLKVDIYIYSHVEKNSTHMTALLR